MYRLVESIKCEDGILQNVTFHNDRMIRSLYDVFGLKRDSDLENIIRVPQFACKGIFKCRVIYDDRNISFEFLQYSIRPVRTLKLVYDDNIFYPYKFEDRDNINRLMSLREDCDDILIIKNGMVTDSSYSNVIFRDLNGVWVTPSTCLLRGTRRAGLLKSGLIREESVSFRDIKNYTEMRLINAMISFGDSSGISVSDII